MQAAVHADPPEAQPSSLPGWRRWATALQAPAWLFVIVVGFCWKFVLTNQFAWLESPDLASQVLPWLQFQVAEFRLGRFPLWDPYLYGGQSLLGQAQPGLAYPLNWLFYWMHFGRDHLSLGGLTWYFVLTHWLAALFAYALARDLGRSRTASVAAGTAFALGGYVGTVDWPQMLNGAIWAPLVFLFLLRALRGFRPTASAALAGLFLGVSFLSGHHQIPTFTALGALGLCLHDCWRSGRVHWPTVRLTAVFLVFCGLVGAMQILPALEYGRLAKRWVSASEPVAWNEPVPYTVHRQFSNSPKFLFGLVVPGYQDVTNMFVGVVGFCFGLLGVAHYWHRREVRQLTGLAIGGLLFSLARYDVFHGLLYAVVPGVEKARTPAHAVSLMHLSAAVLLAFGLDRFAGLSMLELPAAARRTVWALGGLSLLTALMVIGTSMAHELKPLNDDRIMMSVLVATLLAASLYAWSRGYLTWTRLAVFSLCLLLIEISNVSFVYVAHREEKDRLAYLYRLYEARDIIDYLKSQPAPLRVDVPSDTVLVNLGDWYGIDTMGGYVASLQTNVLNADFYHSRTQQLYGVGYAISRKPMREGLQEVFRGSSGLNVYKRADVFPRAWTVHDLRQISRPEEARWMITESPFNLRQWSFLYGEIPSLAHCEGQDQVLGLERGINRVRVKVDMKCRGMLVVSENTAPGWQAKVDGQSVKLYDAYSVLRGVVVEAGTHQIEFVYRPWSFFLGAALTLLGIVGAVLLHRRSLRAEPA